jgi:RNA polymerase sigma-70 factor (ECF subfamily)
MANETRADAWRFRKAGRRPGDEPRKDRLQADVRFETTQWTLVLAAGGGSSAARHALARLCEIYWYPIYAYIRRRGADAEDARDLTQAFFASLLERRSFDDLSQDRGRFRAYLLAAARHFLSNDAVRRRALKRGGPAPLAPVPLDDAEGRYRFEPAGPATPETLFDRRWALTVIDRVLASLRRDAATAGGELEFDRLKACLLGDAPPGGYQAVAAELGTTEGAVRVAVHRLRRKFQSRLRAEIAATVAGESDVDDEIRYLIRALAT